MSASLTPAVLSAFIIVPYAGIVSDFSAKRHQRSVVNGRDIVSLSWCRIVPSFKVYLCLVFTFEMFIIVCDCAFVGAVAKRHQRSVVNGRPATPCARY